MGFLLALASVFRRGAIAGCWIRGLRSSRLQFRYASLRAGRPLGAFAVCREAACAAARTSGGSWAVSGLCFGAREPGDDSQVVREHRPVHGGGQPLVAARLGLAAQEVVLEDAHPRVGLCSAVLAGGEEFVLPVASREFGGVSRAGRVENVLLIEEPAVGSAGKAAIGADAHDRADAERLEARDAFFQQPRVTGAALAQQGVIDDDPLESFGQAPAHLPIGRAHEQFAQHLAAQRQPGLLLRQLCRVCAAVSISPCAADLAAGERMNAK